MSAYILMFLSYFFTFLFAKLDVYERLILRSYLRTLGSLVFVFLTALTLSVYGYFTDSFR